jgi:hypothetical protein
MHHRHNRLALLLCTSLLFASSVLAMPQFSARTGERCQSCHVDPMGLGMRTLQGAAYGRDDLPMTSWKDATDLEDLSPNLTKFITVGFDARSVYFYEGQSQAGSFFQMEGNLYLDFRLNKKFQLFLSKGLYSGFEIFGIARVLPMDGYIKVGKFIPAYGTRIDDHNAFIRGGSFSGVFAATLPPAYPGGLRFGERAEDNGVEVGISPSIFTFTAGVFDGTPGGGLTGTSPTKNLAVALRGEALIPSDNVNITLGGSFYNYPNPAQPGKTQFYGGFGSIGLMKNLTLLAEMDWSITDVLRKQVTGRMLYTQLDYAVAHGVDLFAGYEFYDPDINLANGTAATIALGAGFFPMSGVEVRPTYKIHKETPVEISNNEFEFLFHFYF